MFRFTIRDVLLVTVSVALALGWGIHSHRLSLRAEVAELRVSELERLIESWGETAVWNSDKTRIIRPHQNSSDF